MRPLTQNNQTTRNVMNLERERERERNREEREEEEEVEREKKQQKRSFQFPAPPNPAAFSYRPSPSRDHRTSSEGRRLLEVASASEPSHGGGFRRRHRSAAQRRIQGQSVHHLLLFARARGDHGARGAARGQLRRRRGGHAVAGGGDAAGPRAGEDAGAPQGGGRAGDRAGAAPGRRRLPLRHPLPLRHDGRPVQGLLRRHPGPLRRPAPRRQARRHFLEHRIPRRRPGAHSVDGDHPARPPRDPLRACRLHIRHRHVRDGGGEGRLLLRIRHLRRRRLSSTHRSGAPPGVSPRPVRRRRRQQAQGRSRRRRAPAHNRQPCRLRRLRRRLIRSSRTQIPSTWKEARRCYHRLASHPLFFHHFRVDRFGSL